MNKFTANEIKELRYKVARSAIDSKIEEVANGLGLGEIGLDHDVANLSGGQRSKVLLTKLLLAQPMILILDEPTNFLDEAQINWLRNYLANYENAFILVSHDIPFLNSVINVIYHMEDGTLTRYTGNYDSFMEMYELKKRHQNIAYEKQQKEREREEGEKGCFQIFSFMIKCCVIYLNWYLVPMFLRFLCLNIFGISEESFESYPYLFEICMFIELLLAFLLLYKTRTWDFIWCFVPLIQFILFILFGWLSR